MKKAPLTKFEPQPDRLYQQILEGVDAPLDPSALWHAPRLFGLGRESLRDVIRKQTFNGQVPRHVKVYLSTHYYERARFGRGDRLKSLASELSRLHAKDFGAALHGVDAPRYVILELDSLQLRQVLVRLGNAEYVRHPDDRDLFQVDVSADGTFTENCSFRMPEAQDLALLGGAPDEATLCWAGWPFTGVASLALFHDRSSGEIEVRSQPKAVLDVRFDAQLGLYRVQARGKADSAVAFLRITRLLARPARDVAEPLHDDAAAVAGAPVDVLLDGMEPLPRRPGDPTLPARLGEAGEPVVGPTVLQDPDDAPTLLIHPEHTVNMSPLWPALKLRLAGIALQKPTQFKMAGVQGMRLPLDETGQVVPPDSAPGVALELRVDERDQAEVVSRSGRRPLRVGERLPLLGAPGHVALHPMPPRLNARYLGWVELPPTAPLALDTAGGAVLIGRANPALRRIRPLAAPGFVPGRNDRQCDVWGLSSEHVSLTVGEDGRVHAQAVAERECFVLDRGDHQGVDVITVRDEAPVEIPPHALLLVGPYVWAVEADPPAAFAAIAERCAPWVDACA